jgi:hypothetical protein
VAVILEVAIEEVLGSAEVADSHQAVQPLEFIVNVSNKIDLEVNGGVIASRRLIDDAGVGRVRPKPKLLSGGSTGRSSFIFTVQVLMRTTETP